MIKVDQTLCTCLLVGSISTAEGSALVKFGNTTAVCGVKTVRVLCNTLIITQGF